MFHRTAAAALLPLALSAQIPTSPEQTQKLKALVAASPKLALSRQDLAVQTPPGDYVSSVAVDRAGLIYAFQRGDKADPILVFDQTGKLVRSFGKGLYKIPHSIRIDPKGNIWTVDAESSVVYQHTPDGRLLLKIEVGGQPERRSNFRGTTDICFGPNGRLFISDGYGNARVLEYDTRGKKVREWSRHGTGDGEMFLPHGIAIDKSGTLFVADRENGRIQRFTMEGKFLGLWDHLGKTFSITITPNEEMWIGTQPRTSPNGQDGWILKIDKKTGKILGHVESPGTHSVALLKPGQPVTGARPNHIIRFRPSK